MQRKRVSWLTAAFLLMLSAGIARAQFPDGPPPGGPPPDDGGGPPGMSDRGPGRELKTLTKLLSLNSDQKVGVKAILDDQTAQMHALFAQRQSNQDENNTQEAWQARMAKVEQIREDANTKIAALLNDSQKTTFAAWLAKQKEERQKRQQQDGGDGPPPPPPDGGGPPGGGGPPPGE